MVMGSLIGPGVHWLRVWHVGGDIASESVFDVGKVVGVMEDSLEGSIVEEEVFGSEGVGGRGDSGESEAVDYVLETSGLLKMSVRFVSNAIKGGVDNGRMKVSIGVEGDELDAVCTTTSSFSAFLRGQSEKGEKTFFDGGGPAHPVGGGVSCGELAFKLRSSMV